MTWSHYLKQSPHIFWRDHITLKPKCPHFKTWSHDFAIKVPTFYNTLTLLYNQSPHMLWNDHTTFQPKSPHLITRSHYFTKSPYFIVRPLYFTTEVPTCYSMIYNFWKHLQNRVSKWGIHLIRREIKQFILWTHSKTYSKTKYMQTLNHSWITQTILMFILGIIWVKNAFAQKLPNIFIALTNKRKSTYILAIRSAKYN